MKLSEVQRSFARSIKDAEPSGDFLNLVREASPATAKVRLDVYRAAYKIRMVESLRDDFARTEEKAGESEFQVLAESYLSETPSRYASLAEFSQGFPDFLRKKSPALYRTASIDWIEILASHARVPDADRVLSASEIQDGASYRIIRNPTLHSFTDSEGSVLAYRAKDVTFTKNLEPSEFQILELFANAQEPDSLALALAENEVDADVALPLISEWVTAEILYCERN